MQLFPATQRMATQWKNGGGITWPVAEAPGKDREFGWRLSLADVAQAGPFSVFPGISRLMGILEGRLLLEVQGYPVALLRPDGPAHAFPGDVPAFGTPQGKMVRDVNLMFDPDCFTATLEYEEAGLERLPGTALHLVLALAPLTLNGASLARLDAALLPAGTALSARGGPCWLATLKRRDKSLKP
ncbi:HutD/Ves family protein [Acidocella facilis]|uniref:HutD/Ves family protein n=1 Tax=Acidocella facilis TaxID=525 RepID=UPI001F47B5E3|nr:HutD family protein [Acidocella facilis]